MVRPHQPRYGEATPNALLAFDNASNLTLDHRVVGVPVHADWNAPFLFFVAFLAELY